MLPYRLVNMLRHISLRAWTITAFIGVGLFVVVALAKWSQAQSAFHRLTELGASIDPSASSLPDQVFNGLDVWMIEWAKQPPQSSDDFLLLARIECPDSLDVDARHLDDTAWETFRHLKHLEWLRIRSARLSPHALDCVSDCTMIEALFLHECEFEGAAIRSLAALPELKHLVLTGNAITGNQIKDLPQLTSLLRLSILDADIGDEDMAHLKELPELDHLFLHCKTISDDSIPAILAFPNLRYVSLRDTQISEEGVDRLRKSLDVYVLRADYEDNSP